MSLHLAVVENDHARVSVVLLLHLVLRVDALPLDLGAVWGPFDKPIANSNSMQKTENKQHGSSPGGPITTNH